MKFTSTLIPLMLVLIPITVLGMSPVSFSDLESLIRQSPVIVVAQGAEVTPGVQIDGIANTQFEFIQSIKGDVPSGTNSVGFQLDSTQDLLGTELQKQQRVVLFLTRFTGEHSHYISSGNSVAALPVRAEFDLARIRGQRPESALRIIARDYLDSKEEKSPKLASLLQEILKSDSAIPLDQGFQLQPSLQLQPTENDGIDTPKQQP